MADWNFEQDGAYVLDFSPTRDDFTEVKLGGAWSLDRTHALPGYEFACCFIGEVTVDGATPSGDDAWLFSAPFELRSGVRYETGLKYCAVANRGGVPPRLTLRLGYSQDPSGQGQRLSEFSVSNTQVDTIRVSFEVPYDGTYYFSVEAHPGDGAVALLRKLVCLEGDMPDF